MNSIAFPEKPPAPVGSAVCPQTAARLEALIAELMGWYPEPLARRLERWTTQLLQEPLPALDTLRGLLLDLIDSFETAGLAARDHDPRYDLCQDLLHAVNWARDRQLLAPRREA